MDCGMNSSKEYINKIVVRNDLGEDNVFGLDQEYSNLLQYWTT